MENILNQAKQYQIDTTYTSRAHYKAADIAFRRHNLLGIPLVAITAIVATSVFATISSDPEIGWKITTGLVSILASVLAAMQTFFKHSENAEKHRSAGALYSALRREIDMFLLKYKNENDSNRNSALEDLENISKKISELASECMRVSDKAFNIAVKEIQLEKDKVPTSVARISKK